MSLYTQSLSVLINFDTALSCGSPDLEDPARTRSLMLYDCPDGHVYGAECALNCTNGYPLLGSNAITCKRDNSENPPLMAWEFNGTKPACLGWTMVVFSPFIFN